MNTIPVSAGDIHYERSGSGKPVIITHGLAGSTYNLHPLIPSIGDHNDLVLWDLRGHGASSVPLDPEEFKIWKCVDDLRALMNELGIEKAIIGGHSLGGGVAIRFALRHPERTEKLLIFNSRTASGFPPTEEQVALCKALSATARNEGMAAVAEHAMRDDPNTRCRLLHSDTKEVREQIRRMFQRMDAESYAQWVTVMADDIRDQIRSLTMPTLLVTGTGDAPLPAMEFVHQQIRGSRLEVIPGGTHYPQFDNCDLFLPLVEEFVR